MADPFDEHFDYYEVVIGYCTVEGCRWEANLSWSDLDPTEPGGARQQYLAHWQATHSGEVGNQKVNAREIPSDKVLSCGCVLRCVVEDGVNTLVVIPCQPTCANYRNALGLADEQGKPVEYRRAP